MPEKTLTQIFTVNMQNRERKKNGQISAISIPSFKILSLTLSAKALTQISIVNVKYRKEGEWIEKQKNKSNEPESLSHNTITRHNLSATLFVIQCMYGEELKKLIASVLILISIVLCKILCIYTLLK